MEVNFDRVQKGKKGMTCTMKCCQKDLENLPVYEWHMFIDSGTSEFDGEEHRMTMCEDCYHELEDKFVGHVQSSNELDMFAGYGGDLEELDEREEERLSSKYKNELREKCCV